MIPELLAPYPTLSGLYGAIMETPGDDTLRLMFADACEEAGADGAPEAVTAWGEFVKTQYAMRALPPKRLRVQTDSVRGRGQNYYEFEVAVEDNIRVGDRVDIEVLLPAEKRTPKKQFKTRAHGFRVTHTAPSGYFDMARVTCKRDKESVPYPHAERNRLSLLAGSLLSLHGDQWGPPKEYGHPRPEFYLGFLSKVTLTWTQWIVAHARISGWFPVRAVKFLGPSRMVASGPFSGRWPRITEWEFPA